MVRHAQVKGAYDAVYARRRNDAAVGAARVLVPVVREDLGRLWRRERRVVGAAGEAVAGGRGLVDGDVGDEVVLCGRGGAEVEEPEAGVRGDGGEQGGVAGGEGGAVGAGADGEGFEGLAAGGRPLGGVVSKCMS